MTYDEDVAHISFFNDIHSDLVPPQNDGNDDAQHLVWDIASINADLEKINRYWAKKLGVSGPQWMILKAIDFLDRGTGVSGKEIAALMHVDPSFVSTQVLLLEQKSLIERSRSPEDARVVLISICDKVAQAMAAKTSHSDAFNELMFAGLDGNERKSIVKRVETMRRRVAKAALMLVADS